MKKLIYSFLALAMAAMTFTGCEDVPAPYDYAFNDSTSTDTTTTVTPAGEGTADSPYNVAMALQLVEEGTFADTAVYIKGIVSGTPDIDTDYGNAVYYLVDNTSSTDKLEVYRGKYYNGEKFTSTDQIKAGDTLVIKGTLTSYNGTPEVTTNSYIVSINGETSGTSSETTTEPDGSGTQSDPYNVAAAIEYTSALDADVATTSPIYVRGIISSITEVSTSYGNATYYISDDGGTSSQFCVYRGYYLNNAEFTSEDQISVGDTVVVYGNVVNYKGNTPEFCSKDNYIYSINEAGSSSTGDEEETTGSSISIDATDMGFTAKAEATTTTLSDGTVLTFAQGEGYNAPKYYDGDYASVRMYALNTLTITASKTIQKIVITTTSGYNGTLYNGNDAAYAQSGSTTVSIVKDSDTQVSFSGLNGSTVTIVNDYSSNKGGTQLRVKSITIYYAD